MLACDDDGGAGRGSRIVIGNATADHYLFSVKSYQPELAGANTRYSLRASEGLCGGDAFEPDGDRAAARGALERFLAQENADPRLVDSARQILSDLEGS